MQTQNMQRQPTLDVSLEERASIYLDELGKELRDFFNLEDCKTFEKKVKAILYMPITRVNCGGRDCLIRTIRQAKENYLGRVNDTIETRAYDNKNCEFILRSGEKENYLDSLSLKTARYANHGYFSNANDAYKLALILPSDNGLATYVIGKNQNGRTVLAARSHGFQKHLLETLANHGDTLSEIRTGSMSFANGRDYRDGVILADNSIDSRADKKEVANILDLFGISAKIKEHKCNCAADAPCRLTGKCTCLGKNLEAMMGAKN